MSNQKKEPQRPEVTVTAKFLPVLDLFRAKNDVRHSLNGICIAPAGEHGGLILTATDGHRLFTIHDERGWTNGTHVIRFQKSLMTACNARRVRDDSCCPDLVRINGDLVTLLAKDETPLMYSMGMIIDGEYPDWRRVIPDSLPSKGVSAPMNAKYIADFSKAAEYLAKGSDIGSTFPAMTVRYASSSDKCAVIFYSGLPNAIGILMPLCDSNMPEEIPKFVQSQRKKGGRKKAA